jgi:hypothetical protein
MTIDERLIKNGVENLTGKEHDGVIVTIQECISEALEEKLREWGHKIKMLEYEIVCLGVKDSFTVKAMVDAKSKLQYQTEMMDRIAEALYTARGCIEHITDEDDEQIQKAFIEYKTYKNKDGNNG